MLIFLHCFYAPSVEKENLLKQNSIVRTSGYEIKKETGQLQTVKACLLYNNKMT